MAYDEGLEARIEELIEQWEEPLIKKKMFGGIGYMIYGNMCFGIIKDDLIVRASEVKTSELLIREGIRVFDMSSRPMKGWCVAGGTAIERDNDLAELLAISHEYALNLLPK